MASSEKTRSIWRDKDNYYGMSVLSWLPQATKEMDVTVTVRRSSSCISCHTYKHADNLTIRRLRERKDIIRIDEGAKPASSFESLLTEKIEEASKKNRRNSSRVRMLDSTGKLITVFDSQVQAARILHMSRYALRDRISGKVKDANGFIFEEDKDG